MVCCFGVWGPRAYMLLILSNVGPLDTQMLIVSSKKQMRIGHTHGPNPIARSYKKKLKFCGQFSGMSA